MHSRILASSKHIGINHNVTLILRNMDSMKIESIRRGHNAATNSMLKGIAHYLTGDGILNQGWHMLSNYVPKYISLGTMGLINQDEDDEGLPSGIGDIDGDEISRFDDYMLQVPGYGADGYDQYSNNGRTYFGLGPEFASRPDKEHTINCELISTRFPRVPISYREIVPETRSEFPETIDIVFSAMISVGALSEFREQGKDYLFITEAGLWSKQDWASGGDNGLVAGYRLVPSDSLNWYMSPDDVTQEAIEDYIKKFGEDPDRNMNEVVAEYNRKLLKQSILRVNSNQVVQVIWKIQLGGLSQLIGIDK